MIKHGLLSKPQKVVRPKWSLKKVNNEQSMMKLDIDEMTSDWDSECDEDVINYFYPAIGEELVEMSMEMKRKIKRQVIEDLKLQRDELFNQAQTQEPHSDGIYLGTEPAEVAQVELNDFLPSIPISKRKIRKLPINDNEVDLNEYGILYADTVVDRDDKEIYDKKPSLRKLEDIPGSELIGFKVGKDTLGEKQQKKATHQIRTLTDEEKRENDLINEKNEQYKFHDMIKKKFSAVKPPKVLDLNNYDDNNESHRNYLNNKLITNHKPIDIEEDLELLLGNGIGKMTFDETASQPTKDDDILNELLGI